MNVATTLCLEDSNGGIDDIGRGLQTENNLQITQA